MLSILFQINTINISSHKYYQSWQSYSKQIQPKSFHTKINIIYIISHKYVFHYFLSQDLKKTTIMYPYYFPLVH